MTLVNIAFRRILTPVSDRNFSPKRRREQFDIILESHDGDRSVFVDGKKYSPILDSIRDDLEENGYSCISLAKPGSKYTRKAYGSPVSAFSVVDEIVYQVFKVFDKLFNKKNIYSSKYAKYIYLRMLKSYQPTLVIGIQPSIDLVVLCNQSEIPVVDILHGYGIVPSHLVYGVDAMARARNDELCSDYIALDKISKTQIERSIKFASKDANVWSIQSPVLDASRPFHHIKMNYGNRDKYHKTCLITLQWGINRFESKNSHQDGELHPKIRDLIKDCMTESILFIVKPHPMINRNARILNHLISQYSEYDNVVVDSESTLYSLLSLADVHMTIFSTTVREAALTGVPSMIFSTDDEMFSGENYMFKPEIENGIAQLVGYESIDDVVSKIFAVKRIVSLPRTYADHVVSSNKNICSIIKKIIKESR